MVQAASDTSQIGFCHAASTAGVAAVAAGEVAAALRGFGEIHLLQLFVSAHHIEEMPRIAEILRRALNPGVLLGVGTDAVIAGDREFERSPGVAVLAARLPGVRATAFASSTVEYSAGEGPDGVRAVRDLIGASATSRATVLFADPFSTPINRLIALCNGARVNERSGAPAGVLVGGMASGGAKAGQNMLMLDDRVLRTGFVGVTLDGPVRVDTVVSQGCRPIGENLVITKAKNNAIFELGGRPALDVLRAVIEPLGGHDRELLQMGLFLGRVVSEYKPHFGRGDFLIRNVAGVNPNTGVVAVQDLVRVGQTVRFHLRDAETAAEDLELLLDAQKLHGKPAGVLLITCTGRGRNLFAGSSHDARTIQRAFRAAESGPGMAKPGRVLDTSDHGVPLAGFFAGGEIGPIAGESYLHGHSACAVVFRE
ncbi:MAG: FIST C-terminal domain-containing protein [Phycisphaerales bacterium]|nr:FIST C-terminal domain-containing protein [Phycisphaerales bacterium]